jgi:hypothetical protein
MGNSGCIRVRNTRCSRQLAVKSAIDRGLYSLGPQPGAVTVSSRFHVGDTDATTIGAEPNAPPVNYRLGSREDTGPPTILQIYVAGDAIQYSKSLIKMQESYFWRQIKELADVR